MWLRVMAGMDDDDIEWELSKMEEAERRREAPPQPLRTVYRPVDPGLAARIFRQMGQPYDPKAIEPREAFYLNGWDYRDEDGTVVEKNRRMEPAPLRNGAMGPEEYDPWKKAWKLDWGEDGRPAEKTRTMETKITSFQPEDYSNEIQLASVAPPVRAFASFGEGGKVTLAKPISRELVKEGTEGAKEVIKLNKFGEKAYKTAKEQEISHNEAMEIAREAQALYTAYKAADLGINALLLKKPKIWPPYGVKEGAEEIYDDDIHNYIIQTAINNYKLGKNPPEGSILPP